MADGHELEMQPPRQAGHHVRLLRPRLPRLQRVPDLLGDGMARLGSFSQQLLAGPGALVDRSPMGSPVSDTAHRTSLETASLASRLPGAVRLAGRRVLVVERSLSARMLLAAHLRLLGCVVEVASPGRDMVEKIAVAA